MLPYQACYRTEGGSKWFIYGTYGRLSQAIRAYKAMKEADFRRSIKLKYGKTVAGVAVMQGNEIIVSE